MSCEGICIPSQVWSTSLWQVTAYRHMICISPLCAISCLTHLYTVHFTLNTTHPYHIYILYLVTTLRDVFCELRSGLVIPGPRWAWRSLITNLQLPETIEGEWVPIGFENQLSPLWKFGRGARDTFMKKKYKSRKIEWSSIRKDLNNQGLKKRVDRETTEYAIKEVLQQEKTTGVRAFLGIDWMYDPLDLSLLRFTTWPSRSGLMARAS